MNMKVNITLKLGAAIISKSFIKQYAILKIEPARGNSAEIVKIGIEGIVNQYRFDKNPVKCRFLGKFVNFILYMFSLKLLFVMKEKDLLDYLVNSPTQMWKI